MKILRSTTMAMHQLSIFNNRSRAGRHDGSMSVVKRLTGATGIEPEALPVAKGCGGVSTLGSLACALAGAVVSGVVGLVHALATVVVGRSSPFCWLEFHEQKTAIPSCNC